MSLEEKESEQTNPSSNKRSLSREYQAWGASCKPYNALCNLHT
jgi:hypothetical protein